MIRLHNPYRIFRGIATEMKPRHGIFETATLSSQMAGFFIKGGSLGFLYGLFDVTYVSGIKNPRAQIARSLYFAAPVATMGLSIPAFKSCLSALSVHYGGNPEATWTYALTPAAPALILGYYTGKTWNAALPLFVYGSLIMIGYRLSLNIGPVFNPDGRPPIRTSTLEPLGKFRWGNESKIVKLDTEGPVWKQFVDQDKK